MGDCSGGKIIWLGLFCSACFHLSVSDDAYEGGLLPTPTRKQKFGYSLFCILSRSSGVVSNFLGEKRAKTSCKE